MTILSKLEKAVNNKLPYSLLLLSVLSFGASYGFLSWSVDTGSFLLYFITFMSVYFGFHFLKEFIKIRFLGHGRTTRKTR